MLNKLSLNDPISFIFMWYMTINKIQVELVKDFMPLRDVTGSSLKFIWHMISNKTQTEVRKGGYMQIWTGVPLTSA